MYGKNPPLTPEARAYQAQAAAQLAEARANLARADEAERQRIAAIVARSEAEMQPFYAQSEAEAHALAAREQAAAAQREAEAQQREAAERERAQQFYLAAGGVPELFEQWYTEERQRQAVERIEQQRAAMRLRTHHSF